MWAKGMLWTVFLVGPAMAEVVKGACLAVAIDAHPPGIAHALTNGGGSRDRIAVRRAISAFIGAGVGFVRIRHAC